MTGDLATTVHGCGASIKNGGKLLLIGGCDVLEDLKST